MVGCAAAIRGARQCGRLKEQAVHISAGTDVVSGQYDGTTLEGNMGEMEADDCIYKQTLKHTITV